MSEKYFRRGKLPPPCPTDYQQMLTDSQNYSINSQKVIDFNSNRLK